MGREYGLRAIRIPREPGNGTWSIAPWLALMRTRAKRAGLVCNDYALGVNDAGTLTEKRVLQLLDSIPDGVTEMFFHPATASFAGADRGIERYQWSAELAALTAVNGSTLRRERFGTERLEGHAILGQQRAFDALQLDDRLV